MNCRPLRGLFASYLHDPGVPLRFTPGFMLSPRFAGSIHAPHSSLHLLVYPSVLLTVLYDNITCHRSISPKTISSVPIIATTSATRCPRQSFLSACKFMKHGGRTRTRQGCCVPSETK